jgi:hypothetical protein
METIHALLTGIAALATITMLIIAIRGEIRQIRKQRDEQRS